MYLESDVVYWVECWLIRHKVSDQIQGQTLERKYEKVTTSSQQIFGKNFESK